MLAAWQQGSPAWISVHEEFVSSFQRHRLQKEKRAAAADALALCGEIPWPVGFRLGIADSLLHLHPPFGRGKGWAIVSCLPLSLFQ
jgi:hypothetical protein